MNKEVMQVVDLISGRGDGHDVSTMGARDAGYYKCDNISACVAYVKQYVENILPEDIGGQEVPALTDAEVLLVVLELSRVKRVVSSLNGRGKKKLEEFIARNAKCPEEWNLEAAAHELVLRDWNCLDAACSVTFELSGWETHSGAAIAEYFDARDFVIEEEIEHV